MYLRTKLSFVKYAVGIILLIFFFVSCNTLDVYEKNIFFPDHSWKSSEKASFSFNIKDTIAAYLIYVVIRHEDAYHYNNIWLNITTKAPGDSIRNQMVSAPLANNKKGWLGTGMDDIYDHRVKITRTPVKLKKGIYEFTLQQNMREEPLQFILNAGIRVEKIIP